MIEEFGADTVRLYLLASSQVWLPKRFDRGTITEVAGRFFNALQEQLRVLRAATRATDAGRGAPRLAERRWPTAGCSSGSTPPSSAVAAAWADYDVTAGVRAIMDFVVDDLSQLVRAPEPVAILGAG